MSRLLIVDDDIEVLALLKKFFVQQGYQVVVATDGASLWAALEREVPDLIILDLMLPGDNGLTLCQRLRQQHATPVIMLTAMGELSDRVVGLEMGADDYLAKPFSARELLARIRSVMRRTRMLPPNFQVTEPGREVRFGTWTLDTTARHLLDAEGTIVSLSGAEYRLLRVFLDHPQRVLNRDQLLNLTQGRDADFFGRSIDLLVSRLRQRLREDAREPLYIKTVRSEGYVFSAAVDVSEPDQ